MKNRTLYSLLFFILVDFNAYSQNSLLVKSVESAIEINGKLEKTWNDADSIISFIQLEPKRGEFSSRITTLKVLQDKDNIYFALICYVPDKNEIAARIQRRDQLSAEENRP